jgi:hypothetical protein
MARDNLVLALIIAAAAGLLVTTLYLLWFWPWGIVRANDNDDDDDKKLVGYQVARITVNGKTGTRNVRLCNSLPRLKDWLTNGHPFAGNPNAPLFCGVSRKNTGRRLTRHSINAMYERYKKQYFGTRLLEDPTVPEEDKRKIRDLLQKKWNPYVRRHTTATAVCKVLKDPVLIDSIWAGLTRAIPDVSISITTPMTPLRRCLSTWTACPYLTKDRRTR